MVRASGRERGAGGRGREPRASERAERGGGGGREPGGGGGKNGEREKRGEERGNFWVVEI